MAFVDLMASIVVPFNGERSRTIICIKPSVKTGRSRGNRFFPHEVAFDAMFSKEVTVSTGILVEAREIEQRGFVVLKILDGEKVAGELVLPVDVAAIISEGIHLALEKIALCTCRSCGHVAFEGNCKNCAGRIRR